jgi:hypothetical protein
MVATPLDDDALRARAGAPGGPGHPAGTGARRAGGVGAGHRRRRPRRREVRAVRGRDDVPRPCGGPRGLVVVLDDLHWADPASLQLAAFVAPRAAAIGWCSRPRSATPPPTGPRARRGPGVRGPPPGDLHPGAASAEPGRGRDHDRRGGWRPRATRSSPTSTGGRTATRSSCSSSRAADGVGRRGPGASGDPRRRPPRAAPPAAGDRPGGPGDPRPRSGLRAGLRRSAGGDGRRQRRPHDPRPRGRRHRARARRGRWRARLGVPVRPRADP